MTDLTLFMPFKVSSAETDMYVRLRPGALVNLLIQSAVQSADALGFGFEGLQRHRLFWVLSRLSLEVYRPLQWHEEGTVETWPKDMEKILYLRDFIVRDSLQKVVCRATSGWLAVDAGTKRPKRLDDIDLSMFVRMKHKHALETLPEKLSFVGAGASFDIRTTYFDIDLNAHVTTTRYVDWMMDTFEVSYHELNYPTGMSINFLRETKPGDGIRLVRQPSGEGAFAFEGKNTTMGVPAFLGYIRF
jgi:medium-chain acyl-[acyl-carrier-protein] hydrolase